jgi:hypothetical protein
MESDLRFEVRNQTIWVQVLVMVYTTYIILHRHLTVFSLSFLIYKERAKDIATQELL